MAKEKQIIKYDLTFETLGDVSQELEAYLKEHNTDAKDIQTALLLDRKSTRLNSSHAR